MTYIEYITAHKDDLLKTYHELHALAEPSWHEEKTSGYLVKRLKKAGFQVKTFPDHYGIIAEIPGKSDDVVALRGDMDALLQEVKGEVIANHSCGHDGHSTMVLYAALALSNSGIKPDHTLRFIFQPAEEKGEGALQMMKDGALERVKYLFGVHVRPEKEVPYQKASPVIIHSSAGTIHGTIKGKQAHASHPEEGINAIEGAAVLVQKLKEIKLTEDVPYSIKMTQLHTENEASNIIPETATFAIDVRARTNEAMNTLKKLAEKAMEDTEFSAGTEITRTLEEYVPAATVSKEAMKYTAAAIKNVLGAENFVPECISYGGEDFHFYTAETKGLNAAMVGLGCGLKPGLHHPDMSFQTDALIYGAKILAETVWLASKGLNNGKEENG